MPMSQFQIFGPCRSPQRVTSIILCQVQLEQLHQVFTQQKLDIMTYSHRLYRPITCTRFQLSCFAIKKRSIDQTGQCWAVRTPALAKLTTTSTNSPTVKSCCRHLRLDHRQYKSNKNSKSPNYLLNWFLSISKSPNFPRKSPNLSNLRVSFLSISKSSVSQHHNFVNQVRQPHSIAASHSRCSAAKAFEYITVNVPTKNIWTCCNVL